MPLPVFGLGFGGALVAFGTFFNFSIPTRAYLFAVPLVFDIIRTSRDPTNEHNTLQFLDWVVGYRKSKCFNERNGKIFQT